MNEYFVWANSFAAPIVSDTSTSYIHGNTPKKAMELFVKKYKHPCGLYAARLYRNADDFHKGKEPLEKWNSEKAMKEMKE